MLHDFRQFALLGALLLAGFALNACQTGFLTVNDQRVFTENSD